MPKSSLEGSVFPALEQEQRSVAHPQRQNAAKMAEKQSDTKKTSDKSSQFAPESQR